jgi:hypothetical protein
MSAPSITSITFNKPNYIPGDLITATITYVNGTSPSVQSFTGTATDNMTGLVGNLTVSFTVSISDYSFVSTVDSGAHIWTKVSDSGSVAVFTATA